MSALIAFLAIVIGAGLLLRGIVDWGLGLLALGAALIAWRVARTPFRKLEVVLAAAMIALGAAQGHCLDGALGALAIVPALELMRLMR